MAQECPGDARSPWHGRGARHTSERSRPWRARHSRRVVTDACVCRILGLAVNDLVCATPQAIGQRAAQSDGGRRELARKEDIEMLRVELAQGGEQARRRSLGL